jgi:dihydroorotase-like cyclic amidohydrolase
MTDDTTDAHGPVDFLLLEFPGDRPTGKAAAALLDLVEAGIVRIYDLLVVRKETDGTFSGIDMTDLGEGELGGFTAFAGARSGLLGDDDLAAAAEALQPGTTAAMIVYENSWAIPFVAAAREAGAQVVARERIPADVLMDVLDELDAADAAT